METYTWRLHAVCILGEHIISDLYWPNISIKTLLRFSQWSHIWAQKRAVNNDILLNTVSFSFICLRNMFFSLMRICNILYYYTKYNIFWQTRAHMCKLIYYNYHQSLYSIHTQKLYITFFFFYYFRYGGLIFCFYAF